MVAYLLSVPSPILSCGVLCHPAPDTKWWETITRPTVWHLADHDIGMKEPQIAQLKKTLGKKQGVEFECVVHARECDNGL